MQNREDHVFYFDSQESLTNTKISLFFFHDGLYIFSEMILYGAAAYEILKGRMMLGDFVFLMIYYEWAKIFFRIFARFFVGASKSFVSLDRINRLMEEESEPSGTPGNIVTTGDILFEHVTFQYREDTPVLKDIHFKIPSGSITALAGASGSGKSTIAGLLLKLYEPCQGTIWIENRPLSQISPKAIRAKIGIVHQNANLLEGTIRKNLLMGKPDASEQELWNALKAAHAGEFVCALPFQLDTVLTLWNRLSTGQCQRIALARLFLKNPDIIILDEATSNIDLTTEKQFLQEFFINHIFEFLLNILNACLSFIPEKELAAMPSIAIPPIQRIQLHNVSFQYPGGRNIRYVLKALNGEFRKGETYLIQGKSGCGKSTLMKLLYRELEDYEGNILFNEQELRSCPNIPAYFGQIAVASFDSRLFHMTIRENLLFAAPNATEHQLYEACSNARFEEDMKNMPKALDTPVGENGSALSGGQRQRLIMARLFLRPADLYIIDEALDEISMEDEIRIINRLRYLNPDSMIIVVSHRLNSLKNAHEIQL